jgi:energy-coupling factor transporter ATP-binding protein EcfA2
MILKTLKYSQFAGKLKEWHIDEFNLGKINLIVGKNATGKSRLLNIIGNLANLVSGDVKLVFSSGDYKLLFNHNGNTIEYDLRYDKTKINKEELIIDGNSFLKRGKKGVGTIKAVELNINNMKFQTPENELACVARRDSVQHPFFDDLFNWGKSFRHYYFGTPLGKDHYAIFIKSEKDKEFNLKDTNKVVGLFKKGVKKHGDSFTNQIIKEMDIIGYKIDKIGVSPIPGMFVEGVPAKDIQGIYVKESDLNDKTYQLEISQGMFRALSLIIQLNYSQLESTQSFILIDDIGEGLDYDRSTALIKLLIDKANKSPVQLIMTTNDRYVMNNVPLEYWSVIQRIGSLCKIFNYENSKEIFDNFKFTGLANFDFLSTEFYLTGFDAE